MLLHGCIPHPHGRAPPPPPPTRLHLLQVVPESDRKVYTYRGVCIGRANKSIRTWFKIYNVFPDVGGVVQHFPL